MLVYHSRSKKRSVTRNLRPPSLRHLHWVERRVRRPRLVAQYRRAVFIPR